MLIFGTNLEQVENIKKNLSSKFTIKDMGITDVILGIRIQRDNDGIILPQSHCIENVLKKFGYLDCILASTSFDPYLKLILNTSKSIEQIEYAKLIECLMYVITCIRPDITFAIGKFNRYESNLSNLHWHRILKYLKRTVSYGIFYTGDLLVIEGYTNGSQITHRKDHTYTNGWIFMFSKRLVSWGAKKQTCIIDSIMTLEFVALASVSKETK